MATTDMFGVIHPETGDEDGASIAQMTLMPETGGDFKPDPNGIIITPEQRLFMQYNGQYRVIAHEE